MSALFRFSQLFSRASGSLVATCRRNIGSAAVLWAKADKNADPIQKLFVDKLQEYKKKSQAAGGGLVDSTADRRAKIETEMLQIRKRYGDGNVEEFPKFNFKDKTMA